jgi:hypothetical protein
VAAGGGGRRRIREERIGSPFEKNPRHGRPGERVDDAAANAALPP